ncbi:MAG: OmpH family outer membrane protein [Pseudomonadota bacterium]|nr:OmpH family outer membrane protein [Pseudomonadota bacterium]
MKKQLTAIFGAAALAVAGLAASAGASAAYAQNAPVILIINQAQVLAQSKAGVSIRTQLEKLQEQANTELNAEVEKFVKEAEDLKKQKDLMAEDVWLQKAQQLEVKRQNLPTLKEVKSRELSISEQQALNQVTDKLTPILEKIVKDRGATLLIDRSAVMYAAVDTDITAQVISELDKVITTVKVEKVSLADLQRKAQEAQAKAGSGKSKKN